MTSRRSLSSVSPNIYETIANPVSSINHTPQSFLRGLNALFVGVSLEYLNMRRWLYNSFDLGVEVIWCTDYDDMRACIRDLPRFGSDPQFGRRDAPFPGLNSAYSVRR